MRRLTTFLGVAAVGLLSGPLPAHAERVELVTYYPASPISGSGGGGWSSADRLHVDRATIGGNSYAALNSASDMTSGQLFVETAVGVGTSAPTAMLHVPGTFVLAGGNGDLDGNGNFNNADRNKLGNYLDAQSGAPALNSDAAARARADVNGDGLINDWDLALMNKALASGGAGSVGPHQVFSQSAYGKGAYDRIDRLTLNPAGDAGALGIGRDDPQQQLDVSGSIQLPTNGVVWAGDASFLHHTGSQNTFAGIDAGNFTMTGSANTGFGEEALNANVTGSQNTAFGAGALMSNTAGSRNTAFGFEALASNTVGTNNTAVGASSLTSNTDGINNTGFGSQTLRDNTSGSDNTAVGAFALVSNTTGNSNTGIGCRALAGNTTGSDNTGFGAWALANNGTGSDNTAFGYQAMGGSPDAAGAGSRNTAFGAEALSRLTAGSDNTAVGRSALEQNTTGSNNIALGYRALRSNGTGSNNVAIGASALEANATGDGNVAVGVRALASNTSGSRNTAIGYEAGFSNETGNGNIFIGYKAGYFETGSNKLYIHNSDTTTPLIYGDFSVPYLVFYGNVGINKPAFIGGAAMTVGSIQAASFPESSDLRFKTDIRPLGPVLAKVDRLRGVSYRWKEKVLASGHFADRSQIGLIAQEVEPLFPELVSRAEWEGKIVRTVSYGRMAAVLTEGFKELKARNEALQERLDRLEAALKPASTAGAGKPE